MNLEEFDNLNALELSSILDNLSSLYRVGNNKWKSYDDKVIVEIINGNLMVSPLLNVTSSVLEYSHYIKCMYVDAVNTATNIILDIKNSYLNLENE